MGVLGFFRRGRWDRRRQQELESYIQIETDENIARGMPPQAARHAAHRKLGNSTRIREEIYTMNTIGFFDPLARGFSICVSRAAAPSGVYDRGGTDAGARQNNASYS
jgi:hypothetical protein